MGGTKRRTLIEIIPPLAADGTQPAPIDVTTYILSMGMTVGEPNAIVMLQRPEWANFMQGSRDRKGTNMYVTYFLHNGVVVGSRRDESGWLSGRFGRDRETKAV